MGPTCKPSLIGQLHGQFEKGAYVAWLPDQLTPTTYILGEHVSLYMQVQAQDSLRDPAGNLMLVVTLLINLTSYPYYPYNLRCQTIPRSSNQSS